MTRLFLIRHAECDGLGETIWGRTKGIRLTNAGKTQCKALAERLDNVMLAAIYRSPLERALETAEAVARDRSLEIVTREGLNEINFGIWSGKTFSELGSDERWRRFHSARSSMRIPNGELLVETQKRVVEELYALAQQYVDKSVAVVSHADPIKCALMAFLRVDLDLMDRLEISPASISVVEIADATPRVISVNITD